MATVSLSSLRIAEKLTILNDRLNGLLKRLYFMKKELSSNDKPMFLPGGDKTYETPLKNLLKKFPCSDQKSIQSSAMQPLVNKNEEILNRLSTYFYTLVEISEIKEPIFDVLDLIRKYDVQLDISINFELTKYYLDLITNFSAIMLFLTKLNDIKAIIALFNFAYEYKTGEQEKHVQGMAKRLLEQQQDKVIKQLYTDLSPYARTITSAIRSLTNCFSPRLVRSQNWTEVKFLDILHEPDKLSHTALTDRMCTQLLSVEVMERWIILCTFFIHPELNNTELYNVWKAAYKNSYVLVLFRDEVIYFHQLAVQFFDSIKSSNKRVCEVKELYQTACSQAPTIHKDRRNYLRLTLRQLCQIISDEPGLLGPKSFLVLWALSYATDEIYWLLRHSDNIPPKKGTILSLNNKVNTDEFVDAQLPELLFYIEEIRRLVLKFYEVIQIFYQQILAEYDAPGLRFMVKDFITRCGPDCSAILSSMYQSLASIDSVTEKDRLNFQSLRLDWFRVQFYLSVGKSPISLGQYMKLISHINSTVFHTKMIDHLVETVKECADLSIFCFYDRKFQEYFERNITYSSQHRYAIVFPLICTHYINACDENCPEETSIIAKRALQNTSKCIKNISSHITQIVSQTMDAYCSLSLQLAPKEALFYIPIKKDKKRHGKSATLPAKGNRMNALNHKTISPNDIRDPPGKESRRKTRENQTTLDKSLLTLTQLCFTINHFREIIVWDKPFVPREILFQELTDMLNDKISKCVELSPSIDPNNLANNKPPMADEPVFVRPPTEMLTIIQEYMTVLMNVDKHANIEVVRIFNDVFLSQSQLRDTYKGNHTIVSAYIRWYMEIVMNYASRDYFIYSPRLKSFVTMSNDGNISFRAEEYVDLRELRALIDIIGPYGMRLMTEAITQEIAKIVEEKLKKLVTQNKITLETLRESVHEPAKTRKLTGTLTGVDELLGNLKKIGVYLAFRDLCREASDDVLSRRVPFLYATVKDLQHSIADRHEQHLVELQSEQIQQQSPEIIGGAGTNNGAAGSGDDSRQSIYARVHEQLIVNDLCLSMGLKCSLDSNLCSALETRRRHNLAQACNSTSGNSALANSADEEYKVSYLLFTFISYALPRLARLDSTVYRVEYEGHINNSHCIAYAVNSLLMVMFSRYGHRELDAREKEFMALTSSNLLRLGLELSNSPLLQLELASGSPGLRNSLNNTNNNNTSISASNNLNLSSSTLTNQNEAPPKNIHSVYILFDIMTQLCTCLTADLREACFPYSLIRQAYHVLAKQSAHSHKLYLHPDYTNSSNNASNTRDSSSISNSIQSNIIQNTYHNSNNSNNNSNSGLRSSVTITN